jgi:hypothetical protein
MTREPSAGSSQPKAPSSRQMTSVIADAAAV